MNFIKSMTGYKATDKNMTCLGHKFELNKWYEVEGEVVECKNGFHFFEQPSGVWAYYDSPDVRVFKIEAEDVLDTPFEPGTAYKRVCRRIKLAEEVKITGNWNTGHGNTGGGNTGDWNTGDGNTGDRNTGHGNTGYRNTGDRNTGHGNTGDGNTGDGNTGHGNTGCGNTGHGNTGYRNTGDGNTGDGNTGYRNTGAYNLTNRSSGVLSTEEPKAICFNKVTKYTYAELMETYGGLIQQFFIDVHNNVVINFEKYKTIPNITPEKVVAYQKKYKQLKKELNT